MLDLPRRKPRLVIMLKEPRAGRVKTRLGRDIGMVPAAWWFRHQTARLIRRLVDPRWRITLAISPDTARLSPVWPVHLLRQAQGRGDLGERMRRIFETAPHGPVVIIGADIPGVTPMLIARAFRELGRSDAVFGPAEDGGYWLVGWNGLRLPATLFQNVRWSTEHALSDSIRSLPDARIAHIDTLRDVDTAGDLSA